MEPPSPNILPSERTNAPQAGTPAGQHGGVRLTPEQFGRHFASSWRVLWCIAAAVGPGRSAADDAVQEAAVIALGKLNEFDPATSFTAWMAQIVRFVALNNARKSARQRASSDPLERAASTTRGPAAMSLDPRLQAVLADLDETARACLLMRTVLGQSYKEISAALSIPEGTAMSHVFRARKTLQERLEGQYGSSSGGPR